MLYRNYPTIKMLAQFTQLLQYYFEQALAILYKSKIDIFP